METFSMSENLMEAVKALRKAKRSLDTAKWGSKEQASAAHAYQAATRNLIDAALSDSEVDPDPRRDSKNKHG
jgi:hypothetical protein